MTSERITNLQQRIATSRREVELKEKQAEEEKQRQEAKLEARRAQNIQKLEETGVVVFFREVQKAGILRKNSTPVYEKTKTDPLGFIRGGKKTKNFHPAEICFNNDGCGVDLRFNHSYTPVGDSREIERYSSIRVSHTNSGILSVDGKELEKGQDLISTVSERVFHAATKKNP